MFKGEFENASDVLDAFKVTDDQRDGVNIIYAEYEFEECDGSATVVFERNGDLFEVYGAHCSCYGLEWQWEPELIDKQVYAERLRLAKDWPILDAVKPYLP